MKKIFHFLIVTAYCMVSSCNPEPEGSLNRRNSFNEGWKFQRGDMAGAEKPEFDDSGWRALDLPHDWSIEDLPEGIDSLQIGPFTRNSPGGTSTGFVIGETGWYRKSFRLPSSSKNKIAQLYFDGVYMNSEVWINGHYLGIHPYGYTPFYYDITPYLKKAGENNLLAVKVSNHGKNSRWYSGSGIYRNVDLIMTHPVHIPVWGRYITAVEVSSQKAVAAVSANIKNETAENQKISLVTKFTGVDGVTAGMSESTAILTPGSLQLIEQMVEVKNPMLWSVDTPHLYQVVSEVFINGRSVDQVSQNFGFRTLEFSAEKGFLLNGTPMLLRGGCMHHDNGPLGSAAIGRAEERRVELMKSFGFNAIRTAHNPPSEAFLEACDRLGMLVIDEIFDQWKKPKNPEDYNLYFDEWHQKDLEAMVLRDRNHPSVIMWSIGNEIPERADSSGLEIARKLIVIIKNLDKTRPVNAGICSFWDNPGREWEDTAPVFDLLDVAGYNYQWRQYEKDHAGFPERVIAGTESTAREALENWRLVEKHPYVIGDFIWTAMDYMGETGIGHAVTGIDPQIKPSPGWPWYNAFCGDIDICGFKKPQSVYRDVVWKISNLEIAVHKPIPPGMTEKVTFWGWPEECQSWNWEGHEGEMLDVNIYSNYPEVRLELNGTVIGKKAVSDETRLTAAFKVPFEAGELKVTGIRDGRDLETKTLFTTGKPSAIRLIPDRSQIRSDRNDLSYVTVEVVDALGNVVPDANLPVRFEVSGNGELAGVENGKPDDPKSFRAPAVTSYKGRCLVILRPSGNKGEIAMKAFSESLQEAELTITVN
jgi:beta-galactosidase